MANSQGSLIDNYSSCPRTVDSCCDPNQLSENLTLKLENDQLKEKISELEGWLLMLLNNFYEGTPVSIVNIDQVTILDLI